MSKVLLLQGNQAVVEGAIAAGVKFFAGYPITPSTEVAESLAEKLPKNGRCYRCVLNRQKGYDGYQRPGLFVKAGAYRLCLRCGNSSGNC